MIIIGIHDGHNCGASIFRNGKLLIAISEERITRKKNEYGFPIKSIEFCLKQSNVEKKDITHVAVSTKNLPPKYFQVKRNTTFTVDDYIKEQNLYWYPKIYKNKKKNYLKIFSKKKVTQKEIFYDLKNIKNEDDVVGMRDARRKGISRYLKIKENKIYFFDHHKCHAYYGFYASSFSLKDKVAIITADGGGDNANGSIWISSKNNIKNVYKTNLCNIGRMYRYATLMIGMKPTEHEFKVMGLAGYALKNVDYYKDLIAVYKKTLNVKNGKFYYKTKPKDNYFYFYEKFKNKRFDAISYAIQKNTEDLLNKWFLDISKKYKVSNFVFSGGVAQNIKATKIISENNKIKKLFVPPGPGDESLIIGAAYCLLENLGFKKNEIQNMENPYVGPDYLNFDIKDLKKDPNINIKKTTIISIAKLLKSGKVLARFSFNKAEFGPRALGNRSIIASPFSSDAIHHINQKIKVRDFWMPFAPSIIDEDFKKLLKTNSKNSFSYMTTSLDSTNYGKEKIPAALHPFDKTARPQLITKKLNLDYYNLIKEFKKLSGVGALLNTSFNVHGEPIVHSPYDAIKTFKKSGLEYLYLGNYLVTKK